MQDEPKWTDVERLLRRQPAVADDAIDCVMRAVETGTMMRESQPASGWRNAWAARATTLMAASLVLAIASSAIAYRLGQRSVEGAVPRAAELARTSGLNQVQFVFFDRDAQSIALAGDFNDWNPTATPLRRTRETGVWSVVVPMAPGRHEYAFVVDGERWVADATAPRAPSVDMDLVTSVILVEHP